MGRGNPAGRPSRPRTIFVVGTVQRKRAFALPLGLLTVAAMLPAAWEKRLVDLNVTHLMQRDLAWADYVFVSSMVVQREAARKAGIVYSRPIAA